MATTTSDELQQQPLHILFLPYFAMGHLRPAADMATLFAARGVRCTILTTPVNADIIRPTVHRANNTNLHGKDHSKAIEIDIFVVRFPDVGLPSGFENLKYLTPSHGGEYYVKFCHAAQLLREPFDLFLATSRPPVDALVTDSFFPWSLDAAAAHGVPRLVFHGSSVFARSCNDCMVRNSPLEACPDDDPDAWVSLPGLPHRLELRRRQMLNPRKRPEEWAFNESNNAADRRSFGEVSNSFLELEPDYVEHLHGTLGRRAWIVGPVALATASRDVAATGGSTSADDVADSCIAWLNTKPAGSVLYVSFGTLTSFSPAELREIARGLDLSGKNFVWVIGGTESSEWMPKGFAELLVGGQRGIVIRGWAPQRLILGHPTLGGFVTHCGWNSVLEAVSAGVPMVTWPRYEDQFQNEKLVAEVLKVGVSVGARDSVLPVEMHEVIGGEVIAGSHLRAPRAASPTPMSNSCGAGGGRRGRTCGSKKRAGMRARRSSAPVPSTTVAEVRLPCTSIFRWILGPMNLIGCDVNRERESAARDGERACQEQGGCETSDRNPTTVLTQDTGEDEKEQRDERGWFWLVGLQARIFYRVLRWKLLKNK